MSRELRPPLTEGEKEIVRRLRSRTNLANKVATYRLRLQLTQEELGRRAGTKQSRISEIESLRGNLRLDTLDRIARELGLVVDLVEPTENLVVAEAKSAAKGRRWFSALGEDTGVYSTAGLADSTSVGHGEYEPIG